MAISTIQTPLGPFDLPSGALIVGGQRVDRSTSGRHEQIDPSTGTVLAEVTLAGAAEVDDAVSAANAAEAGWRGLKPTERRDIILNVAGLLDDHHEELSILRSLELGAPKKVGKGLNMAVEYIRYFAGWADKIQGETIPVGGPALNYTVPEPYGTIAALTPWNGGVVSAAMKVIPALVAGNCVVLKPSELAALAPLRFGELCLEAGLPPGVLSVIPGGVDAGEALVSHRGVAKISFTGGTRTARRVAAGAAANLTPVILELGGKSASVVFPDADLALGVQTTVFLTLAGMSGQGCVLPTRMLVHDDVYDEVVERVTIMAAGLKVGRPFDAGVQAGPVITDEACQRILRFIEEARSRGDGTLCTGGHRFDGDLASGFFLQPTVFADVDISSPLAQEEVFGPVLSIIRFSDEDDATQKANDSDFGLGGIVFTADVGRAHRVAGALQVGSVGVNAFAPMPAGAPFGGVKQSGFGREGGLAGVMEFVRIKNVYVGLG